jgi:RsiW-degrading membrane proteinase PrsW (M82 family)
MIIFLYFLTVIAPIIFWYWFFIHQNRADKEPKKLLTMLFFFGIVIALLAGIVETLFSSIFSGGVDIDIFATFTLFNFFILSLGAATEELLKFSILKEFTYNRIEFNQIADGIFYGLSIALGFALAENTGYFFLVLLPEGGTTFIIHAIVRGSLTVLMHLTSASVMGYYLGKKKFSVEHSRSLLFKGLTIAFVLHEVFNSALYLGFWGLLISTGATIAVFLWLLRQFRKTETQIVWRLVVPQSTPQAEIHQSESAKPPVN